MNSFRHKLGDAVASLSDDSEKQTSKGGYIECADHEEIFAPHDFPEHIADLGEIRMNYAVAGSPSNPAMLLIPGQTESWWGYQGAMHLLAESYQVYAIDLRGQGRSTWTPGRYSIDNFGNDLVRFIDRVIKRPVVVSGLSSGGVIAAWLSAFAAPGQILAAVYEDPPLFASETCPAYGHSIRQTVAGPMFRLWHKWLGPQWSINNEEGMAASIIKELPEWIPRAAMAAADDGQPVPLRGLPNLREYDPEWADAFWTGRVALTCNHEAMLKHVKVPVLFTHHYRRVDPESGNLLGASSDLQVQQVRRLVESTGNTFTYRSFPEQPHEMHDADPATYVTAVTEWLATLSLGAAVRPTPEQLLAIQKAKDSPKAPGAEPAQPKPHTAADSVRSEAQQASTQPAASGSGQADGSWSLEVNTPVGKDHLTLTLINSSGNSLTGNLSGTKGFFEIEDGRVNGSSVTFRAQSPMKLKVNYTATVQGDTISGKAKAGMFPAISFTGTRVVNT
ncbi:Alpha/Beta hydrolase protein [Xylariales sp. PMI_506]|nr:Alpha/Beta hydrolase protein [Xylariales sp. PMI_506]